MKLTGKVMKWDSVTSRWMVCLVPALFLAGCFGQNDDLQRYVTDVKARPSTPIEPIPPVRTYTPYEYEGLVARDPFISSTNDGTEDQIETTSSAGPRPDFNRPREYLERFELDALEMVGTFARPDAEWALVRDPDDVVHRVAVENYIGKNHGQVTSIQPTEMELVELISDGAGGWLVREASIALD